MVILVSVPTPVSAQVTPRLFGSLLTVAVSTSVPPCCTCVLLVELVSTTPAVTPTGGVLTARELPPLQAASSVATVAQSQRRARRPAGAAEKKLKSTLLGI